MIGISLSLVGQLRSTSAFSPASLFSLSEPGVWFDPSDVADLNWRRNLLLWTEQFDNAYWTKTAATIDVNAIAAPDGTMTADKLVETAVLTSHSVAPPAFAYVANTQYTYSVYVRAAERTWLLLQFASTPFGGSTRVWFDLTAGVPGFTQNCLPDITPVGNDGWYRCSITATATIGGSQSSPVVTCATTANSVTSYNGVLGSGLYIWGAQLEVGTRTDYQPIDTTLDAAVISRFPYATLYQDHTGVTPVYSTGQTVGLMLDKSKGAVPGPELVTNGDFSSATGWTLASSTISAGRLDVNAASSLVVATGTSVAAATGTPVIITFDVTSFTSGSIRAEYRGLSSSYAGAIGSFRAFGVVSAGGAVQFRANAGTVLSIDNVSIKEIAGNHATQATTTARPTYGIEPAGGTRNILTFTEQYDNAIWLKGSTTVVANAAIAPTGTTTADLVYPATSGNTRSIRVAAFSPWTGTYTASVYAKASGIRYLVVLDTDASGAGVGFDLQDGTYTISGIAASDGTTASITPVGDGWYRCVYTSTNAYLYLNLSDTINGIAVTANGTDGIYLWGAQLELGSTATDYQRVTTQFDVTEAGKASMSYLWFDGISDAMGTSTITPGIDKAQVFAGVKKTTGNNNAVVVESSVSWAANAGSFAVIANDGSVENYGAKANFTTLTSYRATRVGSTTDVVSLAWDFSATSTLLATQLAMKLNGVSEVVSGTGGTAANFLAYPLYLGGRGGAAPFLSGQIYSLITRFGPTLDALTIASTETWVAGKTGFYAPVITGVPTIGVS